MFLFNWDNVPGKDDGKLIEYLEQKYGVDWIRTAKREAFFVVGASILILTAASVYLFFTLRDTISVLKIHEEELQASRDAAQEMRLASLESTRLWRSRSPLAETANLINGG